MIRYFHINIILIIELISLHSQSQPHYYTLQKHERLQYLNLNDVINVFFIVIYEFINLFT